MTDLLLTLVLAGQLSSPSIDPETGRVLWENDFGLIDPQTGRQETWKPYDLDPDSVDPNRSQRYRRQESVERRNTTTRHRSYRRGRR